MSEDPFSVPNVFVAVFKCLSLEVHVIKMKGNVKVCLSGVLKRKCCMSIKQLNTITESF